MAGIMAGIRLTFYIINPFYSGETPKRELIQTVKTQTKCGISSGSSLSVKGKNLQTKEHNIFFKKYNLTPLDMYNGLSQAYCIKPDGRIH